jgi:ParB-like chromosome segregation protein Spo0J
MPPDHANLEAHPLANEYPMADEHELKGLMESIKSNGIYANNKITVYEGKILDGRNRYKAAKEVGHKFTANDFFEFIGTLEKAEEYVYTSNSARRNLTAEQKKAQALKLIEKHPGWSTRKLAELAGVSHTTIAELRKPKDDDGVYKALRKGWLAANAAAQERLVREFKVDITEMLGA